MRPERFKFVLSPVIPPSPEPAEEFSFTGQTLLKYAMTSCLAVGSWRHQEAASGDNDSLVSHSSSLVLAPLLHLYHL